MKETKVYVDELPENCSKCLFCYDNRPYWKSTDCLFLNKELDEDEIETSRDKDCPLIDIKTHDEEKDKQIKELEQKVQELQEVDNKRAFRLYSVLYNVLERQDPENVASRIDYLTGKDYSEMCELYKTAKNLKQHDRELVKEVCEKIARNVRVRKIQEEWYAIETDLRAVLDQIEKEFEK